MKATRTRAVLLAVVVLTGLAAGVPAATASEGVTIQAGAVHPTQPAKAFEYTRFYPKSLPIHRGQTVTWDVVGGTAGGAVGFHTVTFMPASGPSRPAFLRADEIPGYDALTEDWWRASSCGHVGEPTCVLDDTETFLSSGIPPLNAAKKFSVKVDLPTGSYSYVCSVHVSMQGELEVVDDDVAVPSQAQIDAQRATEIATDTANAEALEDQNPGFTAEDGRKIWNVLLGDSTADNHVAINQYIPASLEISRPDGVRFLFDDAIVDEIHTVSFPSETSGDFAFGGFGPPWGKGGLSFHPRCDPDDPSTGLPGVAGPFGVTPTPCPGHVEFAASPWMTTPQRGPGNAVLPGGNHDSGILAPVGAPASYRALPSGGFLPSTFEAEFPAPGRYVYECNIHSDPMIGSVTVR